MSTASTALREQAGTLTAAFPARKQGEPGPPGLGSTGNAAWVSSSRWQAPHLTSGRTVVKPPSTAITWPVRRAAPSPSNQAMASAT